MIVMSVVFLAGCGASVTSKTNFNAQGGGTRFITAVISAGDAKNLTNGFEELDVLLEQAAPDEIKVNRTTLGNGDAQYQFSIQFSNIDDYNQKIASITGKSHNATWQTDANVFKTNVEFSEEDCTYDLISWAIDAFENSPYSAFASRFTLYDVVKNEFYFDDELVYSGTGDPSFTIESSPTLIKASVYSDFSYDKVSKTVELSFAPGSLERIDLEKAREVLESYSKEVTIDTANSKITYQLSGKEAIVDFLQNADLSNTEDCVEYIFVNNPFQMKYILHESYTLKELLDTFTMSNPNVYHYVKLPEVTEETEFTQSGQEIEVPGQYEYASAVSKDYGYNMETSLNHMVDLKDINITYDVSSDLNCKRSVEVSYIKNNCVLTESQLKQYFPDVKDKISFFDAGDTIRLVFVSQQKKEDSLINGFGFEKLSRQNLKYIRHALQENIDLSRFLPVLEGYTWNMENITYHYQVNVPEAAGLYEITTGDETYMASDDSLDQFMESEHYAIKGTNTADHALVMEMSFKQVYHLFYFWILLIIFLIIVAVLVVTLYYMKKSIKSEDPLIEN